jgi:hypothetical protein
MSGTSECGCTVVWRSPKARPSSVTDRALATASQICLWICQRAPAYLLPGCLYRRLSVTVTVVSRGYRELHRIETCSGKPNHSCRNRAEMSSPETDTFVVPRYYFKRGSASRLAF